MGTVGGSSPIGRQFNYTGLESHQFCEEIHGLMTIPSENASSFTALLELPATQALELLHSTDSAEVKKDDSVHHRVKDVPKPYFSALNCNLTFPTNSPLNEHDAKFSVVAEEHSPETTSSVPLNSSVSLEKVKNEPTIETDSNPNHSYPKISDPTVENNTNQRSVKRKEREKKVTDNHKVHKNKNKET